MKRKPLALRLAAFALAALMLTGCSQEALLSKLDGYLPDVTKNETISSSSKWINSSIDGSIDADTPTNTKDDFYTAINKEFLLEPLEEGTTSVSIFSEIEDTYQDNYLTMFTLDPEDTAGCDPEILAPEKLQHIQSLVNYLLASGRDAEGRTQSGSEPLRPYLEQIDAISSMEDLTDFFRNTQGQNLFYLQLAPFSVMAPYTSRGGNLYTVMISPSAELSLKTASNYRAGGDTTFGYDGYNREILTRVLGRLGYTQEDVTRLLRACYRFEGKLSRYLDDSSHLDLDYFTSHDRVYTREELDSLSGSYPLGAILDACGLGASQSFTIPAALQLQNIGKLYTQKNLEDIKAYLKVHTVLRSVSLLDDETYALSQECIRQVTEQAPSSVDNTELSEKDRFLVEQSKLLNRYIVPYLYDAFQQVYVARFCTAEQKAQITEMTLEIQAAFRETLLAADWLSEETRAEALNKLTNMGLHILYPDNLTDYTALSFDGCTSLLDAVARIQKFQMSQTPQLVNQPVDRSDWNLSELPTTTVNAFYNPQDNSINICAAMLAGENMFSSDAPLEHNLAQLGTIIGHEITHGFDTSGYEFDQDGHHRMWWTAEDRVSFENKATNLIRFYSGLTPVMRDSHMNGSTVSGEAIADMGGMAFTLAVAKTIPDFDYDLYFRSYAQLWRCHDTYMMELMMVTDEHPLSMLRCNVTVSQFDEFQKTYDIQPGDGMYVAPEDRILVW